MLPSGDRYVRCFAIKEKDLGSVFSFDTAVLIVPPTTESLGVIFNAVEEYVHV